MQTESICLTAAFENGASPSWSRGNSPMVRAGRRLFVTNARVHPERKPLNRTTLEIWEKEDGGEWQLVFEDADVFQREPCPIALLGENRLAVSVNVPAVFRPADEPTMDTDCIPMLYLFDISGPLQKIASIRLPWDRDDYVFWEHSYRSFAPDMQNGCLFLDNIEYSGDYRFCYTLLDRDMHCVKNGTLMFPFRCCYHNIAMNNGEIYLFAVRDIKEPNAVWRDYKRHKTGLEWDYDFRQIYLNYCPDINSADFEPSALVCSRDETCGWTTNLDCCFDSNGDMLLLVAAQNVYPDFMRERFFPDEPAESLLELYRFSKGKMIGKTRIASSCDTSLAVGFTGFFHTDACGEVWLVWAKLADVPEDEQRTGTYLSRIGAPDQPPVRLMDETGWLYGSKTRLGAAPCDTVDLYWDQNEQSIMHASFDLKEYRPNP